MQCFLRCVPRARSRQLHNATRWRADFGGKHGKLPMEEPVPLEERRSKAMRHNLRFGPLSVCRLTSICDLRGPKIEQIRGPKMGSIFWTPNGDRESPKSLSRN